MTALLLGALGLTLSLLVPGWLARARWTSRAPGAAIVLWQAITLTGILCALGVALAGPQELVDELGSGRPVGSAALIFALAVATLIIVRLLVSLVRVSLRSRARRARHRMLVDLLDSATGRDELPAELRILDGPLPFAYCVPGRSPRVVLSGSALKVLDERQVAAVIAHEQAHLRQRHELVMESFTAFYRAVPRPLRSRVPLEAVHLLLEMVADDAARRRSGPAALRSALEVLGDAVSPAAPEDLSGSAAAERARRLERLSGADTRSVVVEACAGGLAAGLLVLPTVILVVPWLDRALTAWPW
ncbi:M56 family metallopeptidase [Actinoplanes sp. RD1]|uniref:M56 family metallopeptidase n=1 Tax=Actinoplanes sp. RD1 TaxID=3064538 RepID=UPI002742273F|nr:M56 family metallopeptidase [Actinoplanes sp. RD1]